MLKSIQWKLVLISLLLVWLAMAIVGAYVTHKIRTDQMEALTISIRDSGSHLADSLKDKLSGATEIQNYLENWYRGQGKQVVSAQVFVNGNLLATVGPVDASENFYIDQVQTSVKETKTEQIKPKANENYMGFGIPILDESGNVTAVIYISADFSIVDETVKSIKRSLSSSTILAICITIVLGIILARTITDPIKEVTSKAEMLAKGDFGQVIEVKSNDEVGQLTEMFNYLTVRLKSTMDEVFNEKNKVETILTNMTDGIIAVSTTGDILHANPASFEIFNVNKEDISGKSFDEISKELGLGITCENLFRMEEEDNTILNINDLMIRFNVVKFKNEKNETGGAIIVLQDVTEQERLDKMRKEFVANVSHELRTPLTTIKSYTETLLDGALDNREYAENFLKVIDSESERMTRLVKDLLQLSKLDYDKVTWNKKQMDIARLIKDIVNRMAMSAKQKNQQLSVEVNNVIPEINADKDRIEQVVINIINNAMKYTPDNGKIDVSVFSEDENIVIRVADNGIGIPKEDLPRLFERFYRVDKARSRMLGGTGLGLSIAKQIVEAHNGYIGIDSEYGKGTVVSIYLPYV